MFDSIETPHTMVVSQMTPLITRYEPSYAAKRLIND